MSHGQGQVLSGLLEDQWSKVMLYPNMKTIHTEIKKLLLEGLILIS